MKSKQPQLSRQDFLKFLGYAGLSLGIESLLSACSPQGSLLTATRTASATLSATDTKAPTATTEPTATTAPTATATLSPKEAAAAAREARRLSLIEKYGPATRALPLEFHGDYYYMLDGMYNMDPETFTWMMEWFQENDVWSVNGTELAGFLDGTIQLPARCVVLTTDSGYTSLESLARMIPVLQRTEMHFISLIWTSWMTAEETIACIDDICWEKFREALASGVFTFGAHSESHSDFSKIDAAPGLADILESKSKIKKNLGIEVEFFSWPHEACPAWADQLSDHGFIAAFGGRPRALDLCSVFAEDELRWCLPRLLPPNRGSRQSSRPEGMTIEEMMRAYSDGFEE
jgi:peptidoglycan/xylan/chitin deacetylase (PgdA/CDA1 family)